VNSDQMKQDKMGGHIARMEEGGDITILV
jgi:hypothetical protein